MDKISILSIFFISMVFIWFIMTFILYKRLKTRHVKKYKDMGEPSLLVNKTFKPAWSAMRFLLKREHKTLNDKPLSLLSDSMIMLLVIYLIIFIGLFIQVLSFVPFSK